MKTQKGMQTKIAKYCKRITKKYDNDCLFDFEDKDERSFYFKYDGYLWECLYYSGELFEYYLTSFRKLFEGTGWSYDYEDASVMIIYKED